jgi:enoyl-CoA hydratase/carnithine racemase
MSAEERSGQLILKRMQDRSEGGRVAYITVNNPAKRNMLGMSGKRAIAAAFRELARDDTLRAVVLTGAGEKSFMAGADIAEMKDLNAEQAEEEHTLTHHACEAIRMCPVPVIARINGYCFGLGMEVAASCDMRVAADHAKFGMPEVRMGIPSGMEAALLPRIIGWGKTCELVFTGDHIDAQEALRCRFVEKLVPSAELDQAVEKWVASILAGGARAIRLQKALMRDWERMSVRDAVWQGIRACVEARSTDEPQRLMTAFLNRKKMK